MKKRKCKNYYVMDECLKKRDMDQFGHQEIANNILNLIINNKYHAPYNIALIGKWGLGKSSILKILEDDIKKEQTDFKVISINAWKYERESLKNVFLRKLYEEISNTKIDYLKQLEEKLKNIFNSQKIEKDKNTVLKIKRFLPYLILSLLISLVWQFVHYIANGGNLVELFKLDIWYLLCRYFNFYFENILFTLGGAILVNAFPNILNNKNNIFPIQVNYEDDYETLLKNIIKTETKIKKFIVIIDDLDRLSTKKMVEALDTLKILLEMDKCVFIVPFDDSVLKDALNKQIVSKFDNEQQTIESEFILDKLFQFRFYVPPLILSDMKDYTLNIIKTESKDLYDMFSDEEIDEIVKKVFMYDGLKTPRQIKKIINTFSNNIILFNERIQAGKISKELFNKTGKLMLAKISVLQSDFNDFYDDLFVDTSICEEMIKVNKGEYNTFKEIPKTIQKYCIGKDKSIKIKEQYDKLINFLSRTSYIKSQDISIYLRCNQDKMSLVYGSKFSRDLLNSMQSMNFSLINSLIEENSKENIKDLLINYLEVETSYNLPMIILSILNINNVEFNDIEFNKKYINSISNVYDSSEKFDLQYINLEKLLQLKYNTDDKILVKLLNEYYKYLNANIENEDINHKNIYKITIEKIDGLSNIDNSELKKYLYSLCKKEFFYINLLNDMNVNDKNLKRYFDIDLYDYVVELINDCEDESKCVVYCKLLIKLYNALKNDRDNSNINKYIIDLLANEDNIEVCENILINNIDLFNLDEQKQIVEKIASMSDDKLKLQFSIMNCISFDIESENESLQNKILSYVENDYDVEKMLNNISNYSFINNVIQKINKEIYSNSKFDSIYSKNIEKFTDEQLENLVDTLVTTINIDTYIEGRITTIINIIDKYVSTDKIIKCFTADELIKNYNAAKEITNIINLHNNINHAVIDDYIRRVIELLTIIKDNIMALEKVKEKISNQNLKLLTTTINNQFIETLNLSEVQSLFNIYNNIKLTEEIKEDIVLGLNTLLNTEIEDQVINYMISNNIKIADSIGFIFKHIENLDQVKKYSNLNEILQIDQEFIDKVIQKLKTREYSTDQLMYLCSLNDKILNEILESSNDLSIDNLNMLLNAQKIIYKVKNEKYLVDFQINIIKSENSILIENIIDNFILIKQSENRKIIRNTLIELIQNYNISDLLLEKIEKLFEKHGYRKINKKIKETVKL